MLQFPGATQVTENRRYQTTRQYRDPGHPPVLVLHSVEGRMSRKSIAGHNYPPHLWIDPTAKYRDVFQTMSLDVPALALENKKGGARETNHRGLCFQIELQLFSDPTRKGSGRHVGSLTDDDLRWLASKIVDLDRISRKLDPQRRGILPAKASDIPGVGPRDTGYGYNSQYRLSPSEWYAYGGILFHANVPDNSHYDLPAEFNIDRLVEHCLNIASGRPIPKQAHKVLRIGSSGATVEAWQRLLNLVFDARLAEDGDFGPASAEATRAAEAFTNLPQDGVVDKKLAGRVMTIKAAQDEGRAKRPFRPLPAGPVAPVATAPVQPTEPVEEGLTPQDRARASFKAIEAELASLKEFLF